MEDLNPNQLKLKVNDTFEKEEKVSTNFELRHDEHVINKAHLDKILSTKRVINRL